MVHYPVEMHNDHFKDVDESLENKLLLSIVMMNWNERVGCGGCLMGTHYIYALLDW
jgi:hypothetical protein